jgi:hypothetical protein
MYEVGSRRSAIKKASNFFHIKALKRNENQLITAGIPF